LRADGKWVTSPTSAGITSAVSGPTPGRRVVDDLLQLMDALQIPINALDVQLLGAGGADSLGELTGVEAGGEDLDPGVTAGVRGEPKPRHTWWTTRVRPTSS
jgi:hypothetical protein